MTNQLQMNMSALPKPTSSAVTYSGFGSMSEVKANFKPTGGP